MTIYLPITLSLVSLLISLAFGWLSLRDRRSSMKMGRQRVLANWATQVLASMSEASHWLKTDRESGNASLEKKSEIMSRLSHLIDEGRWYFPNDKSVKYGLHKHELNQGFRDKVLDPPVTMYKYLSKGDATPNDLSKCRNDFVQHLAEFVSPFETLQR